MDAGRFENAVWKGVRRPLLGGGVAALLGLAGAAPGDAKKKKKRKKKNKNKGKQPTTTQPPVTTPQPVARVDAACPQTGGTSANPVRQAQTFRAIRTGKLTSASVYLVENLPGADLDVEIWSVNPSNEPSTVLAGVTIADLPVFDAGPKKLTVTFPTPANVVAGLRYALVLTGPLDGGINLSIGQDNPCADGIWFVAGSPTSPFQARPNTDLHFETVVTA